MKRKLTSLLAMLCIACMLLPASSLAADGEYTINTDSLFPVINEPGAVTLDVVINVGPDTGPVEDMWMYRWLAEKSGVNLNITGIVNTSWNERKAVAMASGDLADIYIGFPWTTDEIVDYGMNQGYFAPLNDYIHQYGDQIQYIFDYMEYADMEKIATTPDGKIYHLPYMGEAGVEMLNRSTYGMSINTAWLEKLGLEVPQTMDELYDVLVAFRDNDPNENGIQDEIPFSAEFNSEFRSLMLGSYGYITPGSTSGDGKYETGITANVGNIALKRENDEYKVVYMPYDEDYKGYLTAMQRYYTEGLLDPDMFTQVTQDRAAKNMQGATGVIVGSLEATLGNIPELYPQYRCFLVTDKADQDPLTYQVPMVGIARAVITTSCEHPDVAVRLLNAFYDPTVMIYNWNGPDMEDEENYDEYAKELGVGFKVEYNEDGTFKTYTYPEKDTSKYETDGDYLGQLVRSPQAGNFINGIYARVIKYNADPKLVLLDTPMGWFRASQQEYTLPYIERGYPLVYLDSEVSNRANELRTPLEDFVYQAEAQFITGTRSIEDDYDSFIAELEALGVQEFLSIYVDAYDAYNAL